jgi:hypothetical protein
VLQNHTPTSWVRAAAAIFCGMGQLGVEGAGQAIELVLAVALCTGGLFGEQAVFLQRQDDGFRLGRIGPKCPYRSSLQAQRGPSGVLATGFTG